MNQTTSPKGIARWKPQPPKLDQDGLTKAIRARDNALTKAEAFTDPKERRRALAAAASFKCNFEMIWADGKPLQ